MTYEETLHYLYTSTPVFEHTGASAYKPGLDTSLALDDYLGNPHTCYDTIHVAGTNGKGSVCHLLAAIFQSAGYKTGLYTSPHLTDYRERIRVNGEMIPKKYVVDFTEEHKAFFEPLQPSFFELTSAMAFDYFRHQGVDIAIIETGLGGRLDSTNIITPILSIITNISKDHTQLLGDTLGEIACEKAGIIKPGVPVVVAAMNDKIVADVFKKKAKEMNAPLFHAVRANMITGESGFGRNKYCCDTADYGQLSGQLTGFYQMANTRTLLCVLRVLTNLGKEIPGDAVRYGFEHVTDLTGLQGRWQQVRSAPCTILDTGHNPGAWQFIKCQLSADSVFYRGLYIIIGFSDDKDIDSILREMPSFAIYRFTQASVGRALPASKLAAHARSVGLRGVICDTVEEALRQVMLTADEQDMIFIGGSNFVVAEALPLFNEKEL
jgi:dihydrofolate synthase/folylpolyglutamate synthase